jgi:hypothetical protein
MYVEQTFPGVGFHLASTEPLETYLWAHRFVAPHWEGLNIQLTKPVGGISTTSWPSQSVGFSSLIQSSLGYPERLSALEFQ